MYKFGGKFVRQLARAGFIYRSEVAFADKLSVGGCILGQIIQPALQHEYSVLRGSVAEGEEVGLGGRAGPILHPAASAVSWSYRLRGLFASADGGSGGRCRLVAR